MVFVPPLGISLDDLKSTIIPVANSLDKRMFGTSLIVILMLFMQQMEDTLNTYKMVYSLPFITCYIICCFLQLSHLFFHCKMLSIKMDINSLKKFSVC